jgi:hypothetical protein
LRLAEGGGRQEEEEPGIEVRGPLDASGWEGEGMDGDAFEKVIVAVKTSPAKKADAPGLTVTTNPSLGALRVRDGVSWLTYDCIPPSLPIPNPLSRRRRRVRATPLLTSSRSRPTCSIQRRPVPSAHMMSPSNRPLVLDPVGGRYPKCERNLDEVGQRELELADGGKDPAI